MRLDDGQGGATIEVTPAMIAAGVRVLYQAGTVEIELESDALVIEEIYQSMAICRAHELSALSD